MDAERWQQIDKLFQAALARAPEFRTAFLNDACSGDTALQQEVEQLLLSFAAAGSFLEAPIGESFAIADKSAQAPSLTTGQQLAHYEIISQLGAGGMGEVYLARDLSLDREIALKLLPAQFAADPERVSRFAREARAASALNHPNIIVIHEVGEESGKHFIATEYIAGETLRQKLNHGCLPSAEAVGIARQVASALAAAHETGLIHRDIKPENIMVRPDGLVKVLDFGLAKPLGDQTDVPRRKSAPDDASLETDPDLLLGSLNYLSPEQVRHEKLDARTDLFSLGVVCYEMLSGVRPFAGATPAEVCAAILSSDPLPITDDHLWPIVSKALAKQRDGRYQSAREFLTALSAETNSFRWTRAALAFVTVAVAIVAGIWFWNSRSQSRSGFTAAVAQKLTDTPGQELFPHLSPDGQRVIFSSAREGNWDIYVQAVGERTATNLTPGSATAEFQAAYSPDGRQIAFRSSRDGGGVYLMNSDGTNVTKLSDLGFNPAWSPDGNELAVGEDISWDYEARNTYPSASRLWAINLATRQRRLITEHDAVQPDWSPHGKRIAFWGEQRGGHRDIWTVAANAGEPVPVTDDAHID
ncbi:MAG TPA: protein kinase, partial [Pyrinomonadaceae bacterium]|nr:protein kinase [Pyrinomonadaceae bacterium]